MGASAEPDLNALGAKLVQLDEQLTQLSIWKAVRTYQAAARARSELDELAPSYYGAVKRLQDSLLTGTVSGPGVAIAAVAAASVGAGISNILVVQQRWANINGLVDRKQALALGVMGLLIAVVALIVSVIPFFTC